MNSWNIGAAHEIEIAFADAEIGAAGRMVEDARRSAPVVVQPLAGCGECEACRAGRDNLCAMPVKLFAPGQDGRWARRMVADPRLLLPVPDNLPLRLAVLVPMVAELLRAVRRCDVGEGETLGLIGDGARIDLARLVADACHVTTAPVEDDVPQGLTSVLHLGPPKATFGSAIRVLGHIGRVVMMRAGGHEPMTIPDYYRQMIIKETAIVGSGRPTRNDLVAAVALVHGKRADPSFLSVADRLQITSMD